MILVSIIAVLGLATLLLFGPRRVWPVELLTHFWPHLIAACLVMAIAGAALAEYGLAAIAFGLALINVAAMPTPKVLTLTPPPAGDAGLTVVWANVWEKPAPLERTLAWAQEHKADLIMIAEFTQTDPSALLIGDYPHRVDTGLVPKHGTSEVRVAAFSRHTIRDLVVHPGPGPHHRPFLAFTLDLPDGRTLNVLAVHPIPPTAPSTTQERDTLIRHLRDIARPPFLIAGDFNATPATPAYGDIPGTRIGAAWRTPTWLTNLPLLGLPIDHIKVSAGFTASAYQVGPFLGSDHRAVLARIHLPTQKTP